MDAQSVVPPALGAPLRLLPFRARSLAPAAVGDPASHRIFARPRRAVPRFEPRRGRVLVDTQPAIHLHEYVDQGRTVRGLVGLLPLAPRADDPETATLVPHEVVHPRQVDELADRMQQVGLQPAPILVALDSAPGLTALLDQLSTAPPTRQYADHAQQHHRIWALRDVDLLDRANETLAQGRGVIADGHHRYAASHRLQVRSPGGAHDLAFVMLVDQAGTPLQIEPIHRVLPRVRLSDARAAALALGATFEFRPSATRPRDHELVVTDGEQWAVIAHQRRASQSMVEWTHERLLPALPRGPWDILFARTTAEALHDRQRRGGVAVLLPAAEFADIRRAAFAGRTLPEKATSFQPKPSLGALMRALRE